MSSSPLRPAFAMSDSLAVGGRLQSEPHRLLEHIDALSIADMTELERLLAGSFLPQFMAHAVFPHLLDLLGQYDAESLFPEAQLEEAKRELLAALENGDLSAAHALELSHSA